MQQDIFKRPKVSFKGIMLLWGGLLLVGILIGWITSLVSNFIYLILVFPVAMGLVAGVFIKSVVVREKIRSRFVVIATGVFAALLIYGSMHFFDYLKFRSSLAKEIQQRMVSEEGQAAPEENVQAFIDYILVEETHFPGFLGFILLEAKEGMSISEVGPTSSDSSLNLGAFTWLLWLVEMVIIGGISIASAHKVTRDLFCEHCDSWVPDQEHIGGVKPELFNQVSERLQCRDFAGLAQMLQLDTGLTSLEFYTRTCKTCNTFPFYLMGFVVSPGKQGQPQSKLFMAQTLTPSERFTFTSALAAPNAEAKRLAGV